MPSVSLAYASVNRTGYPKPMLRPLKFLLALLPFLLVSSAAQRRKPETPRER